MLPPPATRWQRASELMARRSDRVIAGDFVRQRLVPISSLCGIEGWTMRNQISLSAIGVVCQPNRTPETGDQHKSTAAIAGAQRRRAEIGTRADVPKSAGNEAASTVRKLNP